MLHRGSDLETEHIYSCCRIEFQASALYTKRDQTRECRNILTYANLARRKIVPPMDKPFFANPMDIATPKFEETLMALPDARSCGFRGISPTEVYTRQLWSGVVIGYKEYFPRGFHGELVIR